MKKLSILAAMAAISLLATGCDDKKIDENPDDNTDVTDTTVHVVSVSIPETLTLTVGDTETLTVTFDPAEPTDTGVTWTSGTPATATIHETTGLITAIAPGTSVITVTSNDGGETDTCTLTVEAAEVPVTAIALDKTAAFMAPTETLELSVVFTPAEPTETGITWSTDDDYDEVATVDEDGVVTAVGNGTVVITATSRADDTKTATCTITVNKVGSTSFRTNTTWPVGGKIWSDVVMSFGARGKSTFNGGMSGMYAADLRENTAVELGDLYSWTAASQFKDQLCPAPWRVPTKDEFIALDTALGGNGQQGQINATLVAAYKTTWGMTCGGMCVSSSNSIFSNNENGIGYFWSQTDLGGDYAHAPQIQVSANTVNAAPTTLNKANGMNVRCIKDEE